MTTKALSPLQEMIKFIDSQLPEGDYRATDIASNILATAPSELVEAWQAAIVSQTLVSTISRLRLSRVQKAQSQTAGAFTEAIAAAENGDPAPLSVFAQRVTVSLDQTVRRIGDLNKQDCLFIAARYTKRARSAAFEAAVYNALAQKLPDGMIIEDLFSEAEFLAFRESIKL